MKIEFIENSHTYIVDGIITPSVTTLIGRIWMPDMYHGIPSTVLKKAANYGNKVHELIEYWNAHDDTPEGYEKHSYEGIALRRYQKIQESNDIKAVSQEETVAYIDDSIPLYAGKYDMLATVNNELSIVDIKTTSEYHKAYLEYQLTLYKLAIEQMQNCEIKKAYCLWLPKKHLGSLIPVELKDEKQVIKEIQHYEDDQSADRQEKH